LRNYPPESEAAAVGRACLARADELEHVLKSAPRLVLGMAVLTATLATTEPLLPERHKETGALAAPTLVLKPLVKDEAEPPPVANVHTHSEMEQDSGLSKLSAISASGARDKWFFGVSCARCKEPILLFRGNSEGVVELTGGGSLRVTCPTCEVQHDYGTGEVQRFVVSQPGNNPANWVSRVRKVDAPGFHDSRPQV
jgi:hypothetical protein